MLLELLLLPLFALELLEPELVLELDPVPPVLLFVLLEEEDELPSEPLPLADPLPLSEPLPLLELPEDDGLLCEEDEDGVLLPLDPYEPLLDEPLPVVPLEPLSVPP